MKPSTVKKKGRVLRISRSHKWMLVGVVLLMLLSGVCAIVKSFNTASVDLTAHFTAITAGKNPDGSPYDINEVISNEVLEGAVERLGGGIDAATLKKHLSLTGNTSNADLVRQRKNIVDGNTEYSYFPNVYTLTYSIVSSTIKGEGFLACCEAVIKQVTLPSKAEIVYSVAESYNEYYHEKYVVGSNALEIDWAAADSLDYYDKAAKTKIYAEKLSRFIQKKYDSSPEYVSSKGIGYGELYTQIRQIAEIDIENFTAYIIQNGLTADRDALLRQFAYMERMNLETNRRQMSLYEVTKEAIEIYDTDTTRVVFVPALDYDRHFYMNRTKVGMDYLVERASSAKLGADEALHTQQKYLYLSNHFSNTAFAPQTAYDTADQMYNDIKNKINTFLVTADEIVLEGSQSNKQEKFVYGTVYSGFFPVTVAISAAKMFIGLLLISFLIIVIVDEIKQLLGKKETEVEK